jgi:hypothetical protein
MHHSHGDRREDPGIDALGLQCSLHGERIHDGRQYAHMVGAHPVHALCRLGHAAEYVAAADDQAELDACLHDIGDFGGHPFHGTKIDAERLRPHQDLAGNFQEDALEGKFGHVHPMEKREGSEGDTIFSALNSAIRIVSYKGRQIRFRTLGK